MWKYIDNLFMKAAIFLEHTFPYIKDDHNLSSDQEYDENLEDYGNHYNDNYLDDMFDPRNPIGFNNPFSPNYPFRRH